MICSYVLCLKENLKVVALTAPCTIVTYTGKYLSNSLFCQNIQYQHGAKEQTIYSDRFVYHTKTAASHYNCAEVQHIAQKMNGLLLTQSKTLQHSNTEYTRALWYIGIYT